MQGSLLDPLGEGGYSALMFFTRCVASGNAARHPYDGFTHGLLDCYMDEEGSLSSWVGLFMIEPAAEREPERCSGQQVYMAETVGIAAAQCMTQTQTRPQWQISLND